MRNHTARRETALTTVDDPADAQVGLGAARVGLILMALSIFAGVTTETLPVGLLPAMGHTFHSTPSQIGLLVSLYAGLVAILAVPLTLATRRIPRKRLLLMTTGLFAASNVLAAVAPSFAILAVARAMGGVTHAVYFSVCIGYAARLVPPDKTGAALAVASAGISAGLVLGVPLATVLGNAAGWRAGFAALAVLMTVSLVLVALRLPPVDEPIAVERTEAGRRQRLMAAITSNALLYTGQNTLYTYVTVLLLRSGASSDAVGPLLLAFGGVGLIGVWIVGPRLDRHFRLSALAVLSVMCVGIIGAGVGFPTLALVVTAGLLWNGGFGPTASIYQTAAIRARATSEDMAGAYVVATANIGIAAGAAIGGAVLDAAGIRSVAWAAAVAVALAAVVVLLARDTFPRTN